MPQLGPFSSGVTLGESAQWAVQDPTDPLASPFPKLNSSVSSILFKDVIGKTFYNLVW